MTRSAARWASGPILLVLLASGCISWELRRQRERIDAVASLRGSVAAAEESRHPLVVFLVRTDGEHPTLVDHFVRSGPGRWQFTVPPGSYALGAFADVDADGRYQAEPALTAMDGPRHRLGSGESIEGIELVIPPDGRAPVEGPVDIAELQARSDADQERFSLGQLEVLGSVVTLSDLRFDRENGSLGLWRRWDFLFDVGPGIYFLEECTRTGRPSCSSTG